MSRARRRMKNGFTRFQIKAHALNRRLSAWLAAGQPDNERHSRLLRADWQALASRQLREARGLQKPAHDSIKPGTRADARYSLAQARLTPGVVTA
ncbi:hypothetical protein [Hymenobacter sp. YC55]|uniref:hypothetical protein n=1 Tax=Hymenobacter sp. YC55 TaxID=3034019 RepID=UPI0023F7D7C9|nr:hypothetical protein [Hymenobacter sp. YC55]MDF7815367.1 hypothetical protein [Hymenobacter sp. YC55]